MSVVKEEVFVLDIAPDGTASCIAHSEFDELIRMLGSNVKKRVSHVEPTNRLLRWLFHAIRSRVSDKSLWAMLTRYWPCLWQADLAPVNGPVLGPFTIRGQAIDAEVQWLHANLFHVGEINNDEHQRIASANSRVPFLQCP